MAKHIIRYLLDGDDKVPNFVKDGGYFAISEEFVGLSVDDGIRYLPLTVQKLTKAELISRIILCEKKQDQTDYSTEEATELADAFLEKMGLPDYA